MWIAANTLALLALTVLGFADAIYIMGIIDPTMALAAEEPIGEGLAKLGALLLVGVTVLAFAAVVSAGESTRTKLAIATTVGCLALEMFPLSILWFLLLPAAALAGGSAVLRTRR